MKLINGLFLSVTVFLICPCLSCPAATETEAESGTNVTGVPQQILRTGINIDSISLSPNSLQLASSLGLTPVLQRIQQLRLQGARDIEMRLSLLEATQEAVTIIEEANYNVDFVMAEIMAEQNVCNEVLVTLVERRDNLVNRTNQLSFITNGALWTICEGLAIPTWKRSKYGISSGIVGITAGLVPSFASMYAMSKSNGPKIKSDKDPNMLAKIFDYPTTKEVEYPKTVWNFLSSVPAGDTTGKTRRTQLIDRWIADSNIPKFTSRAHSKELDVLTGSVSYRKGFSIDTLNTRHVMLNQLSSEVFKIKRLLMELTMAVRGSKQV